MKFSNLMVVIGLSITLVFSIILAVTIGPVNVSFVDVYKVILNKGFNIGEGDAI
ncbi:hypothetical protein [Clostridium rectalis]|uniref:hypothetical protein n=1 Tax=Clostridium rectalis TaxID=2040295 RepID=UPI001FA947AF|nr:hypothetical protein [Clostridium rectalis]